MFLLFYGRNAGAPRKGTNMASPYKALQIWVKLFSESRGNENLGKVACISTTIIYLIPDYLGGLRMEY